MKLKFRKICLAVAGTAALTLAGCGGGGSGTASGGAETPATSSFIGTAATGAALANATVTITNSAGTSPCVETSIPTSALGSYTCTLKSGQTAPFFVVVTDPTGNTPPMVSIATSTPAAGTPLTVNVTPLTTAIVAQLSVPIGNALAVVSTGTVDPVALQTVTANVVAQLLPVLNSINAPDGYNPFTTSITAATAAGTGNTADMVLDVVKVVADPAGSLALSTVGDPTPITMATATTTGTVVAIPNPSVSTLSQAAQIAAQAFTSCFALPTAERVLNKDTTITLANGGPEVGDVAVACQQIVAQLTNGAGINFKHNGYRAGQFFYGLMTDDNMSGAQFSVPEIMAFYPADTTATAPNPLAYDRAILNIKYIDANGNPGNVISVAARLPGTSTATRFTEWWLVGNQQTVDVTVRLQVRRVEQLNSANTAKFSTFQSGITFSVNAKGPGSNNGTSSLSFARISGPGLPGNGTAGTGLVYGVSSGAQNSMDLYNKTGSLTVGSLCGNGGATTNCPNLWFARTAGIAGTAATVLATNPNTFGNILLWAQGNEVDPTQFVKGQKYTVELFYGTNTGVADVTLKKTLLSDLVLATKLVNLPWNTPPNTFLGAQSQAALDPNGTLTGAQTNLPVDWVQNIAAQQIGGIQAVINTTSGSFGATKGVPVGATSAVLGNVTVPVFNTTNPVGRTLLFSYRMIDSSIKTSVYTYN